MIRPHANHSIAGSEPGPRWAQVFADLAIQLGRPLPLAERNRVRALAWPILRTALLEFVRHHANQLGSMSAESIDDLAAEKALDLMVRCESCAWTPQGWSARQVAGFLSRVARNGVVDHLRSFGPRRFAAACDDPATDPVTRVKSAESPAAPLEAAEYADHLLAGIHRLKPRARMVWLLRVCFEWPSRSIGAHPAVQLPASHVDVELQRTRSRLRSWMESSGFDAREIPPGTFAALWSACFVPAATGGGGSSSGERP